MRQSTLLQTESAPLHVAIIMDGNGRWASARGYARTAGHKAGAKSVRRVVAGAAELGIHTLTLYAFSADNWQRPAPEVAALMRLLGHFLTRETATCVRNGVRVEVIGRRDRMAQPLVVAIQNAEAATRTGARLRLRIAVDYSGRDAILQAARTATPHALASREEFARLLTGSADAADVDLLIRTGGEQRLSDFLLWECAYAEFYFCARMWPEFDKEDLQQALQTFHGRARRFGAVSERLAG